MELRFEKETEYEGIPALRFAANEWLLANDDGCFCLNVTSGINREDGCLLKGAMEMYSCVGKFVSNHLALNPLHLTKYTYTILYEMSETKIIAYLV